MRLAVAVFICCALISIAADLLSASLSAFTQTGESFFALSNGDGLAGAVLCFELWLLAVVAACAFLKVLRRYLPGRNRREQSFVLALGLFCVCLFLLAFDQSLSSGRPVLAVSIAMPGSLTARLLNLEISSWLRRFIEPTLWSLAISASVTATLSYNLQTKQMLRIFAALIIAMLGLESGILLQPQMPQLLGRSASLVIYCSFFILQLALLLALVGLWALLRPPRSSYNKQKPIFLGDWLFLGALLFGSTVLALALSTVERRKISAAQTMAGAHYYSWFPENWRAGYEGELRSQPVRPVLGKYLSDDFDVFAAHIAWAKEAGINFFVFDWWPERKDARLRIQANVARAKELFGDFRFAIQYETLDLKTTEKTKLPGEDDNMLILTDERLERLKKHWIHIARTYANHPSYLRVDGKPVLFMYASRHVLGPVKKGIQQARQAVKSDVGVDLYVVGDEVYFNVPTMNKSTKAIKLLPQTQPDWERLTAFDAITCYNPYDSSRSDHKGLGGAKRFIEDVTQLFASYRAYAATAGQRFIPCVIPGYDDSGVRPNAKHFAIPRKLADGRSTFSEGLRSYGLPFSDPTEPMLVISTWNEWNEGTQIEPDSGSPVPTDGYVSCQQLKSTDGGYGCQHLKELRTALIDFDKTELF